MNSNFMVICYNRGLSYVKFAQKGTKKHTKSSHIQYIDYADIMGGGQKKDFELKDVIYKSPFHRKCMAKKTSKPLWRHESSIEMDLSNKI